MNCYSYRAKIGSTSRFCVSNLDVDPKVLVITSAYKYMEKFRVDLVDSIFSKKQMIQFSLFELGYFTLCSVIKSKLGSCHYEK